MKMKVFFSSYLTLLHISWLKYSCLPLLFHNRAQWCKLLSQRNLQNSFDLYLMKAKNQSIYLQILLQLTANKGHTSITIKSTCYSSSPTRRSIVLIREEIRSPTMHSNLPIWSVIIKRHYIKATSRYFQVTPIFGLLKTYLTHTPYRFNRSYQPYRTLWFCQRNIKYKTPKSQDSRPRVCTFIQFAHVW